MELWLTRDPNGAAPPLQYRLWRSEPRLMHSFLWGGDHLRSFCPEVWEEITGVTLIAGASCPVSIDVKLKKSVGGLKSTALGTDATEPAAGSRAKRLLDNGWTIRLFANAMGSYTAYARSPVDERGDVETDDFEPSQALYRLTEKVFGNVV